MIKYLLESGDTLGASSWNKKFIILIFLVISPLVISPMMPALSYATSFYAQPFPTTIQEAPVISRGKIGTSYSDWGKDDVGGKRIYTYYELQVSEVLKGNASGPTLMIREMGGIKDGIGMDVAGASQYQKGEDVVVLLRDKNSDGSYDVQGLSMGKLSIQADSDGNEVLAGTATLVDNRDAPPQKWTIESLRRLIHDQLTHPSTPPTIPPNATLSFSRIPSTLPSPPAFQLQPSTQTGVHIPVIAWVYLIISLGLIAFIILRSGQRND